MQLPVDICSTFQIDKMAETMTLDYLGSEATKTQIFSASEVAKRLPMVKCIESTSEALKALSSGKGILTLVKCTGSN